MEITILGTSTSIPTLKRGLSSIYIKTPNTRMLLDCGEGTLRQLNCFRANITKIDTILLTHFHSDHIFGLIGLIDAMSYKKRKIPLEIYGPKGIDRLERAIMEFPFCRIEFPITFKKVKSGTLLKDDKIIIKSFETNHRIESVAYSIEEIETEKFNSRKAYKLGLNDKNTLKKLRMGEDVKSAGRLFKASEFIDDTQRRIKVTYSGDTQYFEEFADFAHGSDVLIHEATFLERHSHKAIRYKHSTAKSASLTASKAKVKKLILTHISPRYNDDDEILKEAREIFENTIIAHDLMRFRV